MTATLNMDKLLNLYSKDEAVCKVLRKAEELENYLADGVPLVEDTLNLYAATNHETGLWEVCLEADHGRVIYTTHDIEGYEITITSLPNDTYINNKESLTLKEILAIQKSNSKTIDINLRDMNSLREAKDFLEDDYVLRNIQLNNPTMDKAARLVIWHIRAYRKVFLDYYRQFSFLWANTPYNNARSLAAAMRKEGLLTEL